MSSFQLVANLILNPPEEFGLICKTVCPEAGFKVGETETIISKTGDEILVTLFISIETGANATDEVRHLVIWSSSPFTSPSESMKILVKIEGAEAVVCEAVILQSDTHEGGILHQDNTDSDGKPLPSGRDQLPFRQ